MKQQIQENEYKQREYYRNVSSKKQERKIGEQGI